MADTFQLQVATPERLLIDEQVTAAQIPAKEGCLGVLPGHAPLLSALGAGLLSYEGGGGNDKTVVLDDGFLEIFEDHVHVLADRAEYPRDVNQDEAHRDLDAANEVLKNAQTPEESDRALRALQSAQARLDASNS